MAIVETAPTARVHQVVPFLPVADIDASLRYYVDGLGFSITHKWIDGGTLQWCWLQRGGAALMLQQFRSDGPHASPRPDKVGDGVALYFICDDALMFYREVRARGVQVRSRPFVGNGMWVTSWADPDGHHLYFESATDTPEETELDDDAASGGERSG